MAITVENILDNLKTEFNCNASEIAEILGVAQNTVSGWKSRNAVGTLLEKILEKNLVVSLDKIVGIEKSQNEITNIASVNIEEEFELVLKMAKMLQKEDIVLKAVEDLKVKLKQMIQDL